MKRFRTDDRDAHASPPAGPARPSPLRGAVPRGPVPVRRPASRPLAANTGRAPANEPVRGRFLSGSHGRANQGELS